MRAFPDAPLPWIDLSTGINPRPWPIPRIPGADWARLPEPESLAALEAAALAAYGAGPGWACVAAPGTSVLIALLARLHPGPAAIVGPTYGEYQAAWPGARVVPDAAGLAGATIAIACQPDNPTGTLHDPSVLRRQAAGALVIADESYAETCPDAALEAGPALPGLVVLRSFGKFHGLAGLRLGFALVHPSRAAALRRGLGPWPVSGPAIRIGTAALADEAWRTATRRRLARDTARLRRILGDGFGTLRGTALFTYADAAGPGRFDHLARHGILVRRFADRPGALRFGLPGPPSAWARLSAALATRAPPGERSGPSRPAAARSPRR